MQIAGIGRVIFWTGGSLWIGQSFGSFSLHAHHSIQLCIGLGDRVQFRAGADAPWQSYGAAIVAPDRLHEFTASGKLGAHLFCEPESTLGRALLARFGREGITGLADGEMAAHVTALRTAFGEGRPDDELEDIALDILYALSSSASHTPADERIARATGLIAARLAEPLTLDDVARHVGLSPGRFRHLFVAETGISFRAYLLWTRLNRALELGFGGTPWTEAAHATNFADSAHLSRTTRRMYGLAPSSIRQEVPAALRPITA